MLGKVWDRSNRFEPSLHHFPDINIERISTDLKLAKRGTEDGAREVPSSEATSMSGAELDAIDAVRKARTSALNSYETEMQSYASRIANAQSDDDKITLLVAEAEGGLLRLSREWENNLENERLLVSGYEEKLARFKRENDLTGPPRETKNFYTTAAMILAALIFESALNGYFFADKNPMSLFGGMMMAFIISLLNVLVSFFLAILARLKNLRSFGGRIWGYAAIGVFLAFFVTLNLGVAHFRDALATDDWTTATFSAASSLLESPLGLASIESWLVVGLGAFISCISFWKGAVYYDPFPGYRDRWDELEKAVEGYGSEYEDAQEAISKSFQESTKRLNDEATKREIALKSAIDAMFGRTAITRNLESFLKNCNSSAMRLLREYRESNTAARKTPAPAYFDHPYEFDAFAVPEVSDRADAKEEAEAEIDKVKRVSREGIDRLLKAQQAALDALPTIRKIKSAETAGVAAKTASADASGDVLVLAERKQKEA